MKLHYGRQWSWCWAFERRSQVRGWGDFATHDYYILRLGPRYVALERVR